MKKHTVIMQELKDNRNKIQELQKLIDGKKQNEKMLINAYEKEHNCSPIQARREIKKLGNTLEEIQNEIIQLYVEQEELEEKSVVLSNNYHCAIIHEFVPIICEIMNKYVGKRVGEKTTDKIRNEFYERTGFRFYWSSQYSCRLSIYNNGNLRIELYVYWDNSDINSFFVEELTEEKIRIHDNYIEDVESYVKSIREERQKLKQAMENLNSMIDKYNEKTVGNMHRYNRYYDR